MSVVPHLERSLEDRVAVAVIGDHDILVAAARADWEAAAIVGVRFGERQLSDVQLVGLFKG